MTAKQIHIACKLYTEDHDGAFPDTLDELVPKYVPDRTLFICPLSGPSVPIGYDYFRGKVDDPPQNIFLVGKFVDRRGRRIVVHVDGSGAIERDTPLPAVEK